jgi:hypothetical protein
VRPVREAPFAVEGLDVAVLRLEAAYEPLERAAVVEELHAGLVIDLEADHRGVVGVAGDDRADDPLGVEEERRVRVVDLLARAPGHGFAGAALGGDLGVRGLQPRRDRVGRRAEDDGDASLVRPVEHRLQPVEVELVVTRLPRRPHRFADADDRELRVLHEVEILRRTVLAVVLGVIGGAEEDAGGLVRRGRFHACGELHCLAGTPPSSAVARKATRLCYR